MTFELVHYANGVGQYHHYHNDGNSLVFHFPTLPPLKYFLWIGGVAYFVI